MSRTAVTYLLIAVLLICPGFCLRDAAEGATAHEAESDGCCRRCEQRSTDEIPSDSPPSDPDCICHGAILGVTADEGSQSADAALLTTYLGSNAESAGESLAMTGEFRHDASHFVAISGRHLCALHCVLLL